MIYRLQRQGLRRKMKGSGTQQPRKGETGGEFTGGREPLSSTGVFRYHLLERSVEVPEWTRLLLALPSSAERLVFPPLPPPPGAFSPSNGAAEKGMGTGVRALP